MSSASVLRAMFLTLVFAHLATSADAPAPVGSAEHRVSPGGTEAAGSKGLINCIAQPTEKLDQLEFSKKLSIFNPDLIAYVSKPVAGRGNPFENERDQLYRYLATHDAKTCLPKGLISFGTYCTLLNIDKLQYDPKEKTFYIQDPSDKNVRYVKGARPDGYLSASYGIKYKDVIAGSFGPTSPDHFPSMISFSTKEFVRNDYKYSPKKDAKEDEKSNIFAISQEYKSQQFLFKDLGINTQQRPCGGEYSDPTLLIADFKKTSAGKQLHPSDAGVSLFDKAANFYLGGNEGTQIGAVNVKQAGKELGESVVGIYDLATNKEIEIPEASAPGGKRKVGVRTLLKEKAGSYVSDKFEGCASEVCGASLNCEYTQGPQVQYCFVKKITTEGGKAAGEAIVSKLKECLSNPDQISYCFAQLGVVAAASAVSGGATTAVKNTGQVLAAGVRIGGATGKILQGAIKLTAGLSAFTIDATLNQLPIDPANPKTALAEVSRLQKLAKVGKLSESEASNLKKLLQFSQITDKGVQGIVEESAKRSPQEIAELLPEDASALTQFEQKVKKLAESGDPTGANKRVQEAIQQKYKTLGLGEVARANVVQGFKEAVTRPVEFTQKISTKEGFSQFTNDVRTFVQNDLKKTSSDIHALADAPRKAIEKAREILSKSAGKGVSAKELELERAELDKLEREVASAEGGHSGQGTNTTEDETRELASEAPAPSPPIASHEEFQLSPADELAAQKRFEQTRDAYVNAERTKKGSGVGYEPKPTLTGDKARDFLNRRVQGKDVSSLSRQAKALQSEITGPLKDLDTTYAEILAEEKRLKAFPAGSDEYKEIMSELTGLRAEAKKKFEWITVKTRKLSDINLDLQILSLKDNPAIESFEVFDGREIDRINQSIGKVGEFFPDKPVLRVRIKNDIPPGAKAPRFVRGANDKVGLTGGYYVPEQPYFTDSKLTQRLSATPDENNYTRYALVQFAPGDQFLLGSVGDLAPDFNKDLNVVIPDIIKKMDNNPYVYTGRSPLVGGAVQVKRIEDAKKFPNFATSTLTSKNVLGRSAGLEGDALKYHEAAIAAKKGNLFDDENYTKATLYTQAQAEVAKEKYTLLLEKQRKMMGQRNLRMKDVAALDYEVEEARRDLDGAKSRVKELDQEISGLVNPQKLAKDLQSEVATIKQQQDKLAMEIKKTESLLEKSNKIAKVGKGTEENRKILSDRLKVLNEEANALKYRVKVLDLDIGYYSGRTPLNRRSNVTFPPSYEKILEETRAVAGLAPLEKKRLPAQQLQEVAP